MSDVIDIFVIGPMGQDKNDPDEINTPISAHMRNIEEALKTVLPKYIKPPTRFNVFTPDHGGVDIVDFVFNHIDGAELAIADLSTRSPSVMYELAYFHALGTPVIIIDDEKRTVDSVPFYMRGANLLKVKDFSPNTLAERLDERLAMFFDRSNVQDFTKNPITNFYSAPLVEVSGAASIARGYYRNFIDAFCNLGYGVMQQENSKPVEKLYIVKPSDSIDVGDDLRRYGAATKRLSSGQVASETEWTVRYGMRTRPITAYYFGGMAFDYPRTIGMLANSPRLSRLSDRISDQNDRWIDPSRYEQIQGNITSRLVRYFFHVLSAEAYRNRTSIFGNRIEFITLDRYEEILTEIADRK